MIYQIWYWHIKYEWHIKYHIWYNILIFDMSVCHIFDMIHTFSHVLTSAHPLSVFTYTNTESLSDFLSVGLWSCLNNRYETTVVPRFTTHLYLRIVGVLLRYYVYQLKESNVYTFNYVSFQSISFSFVLLI